MKYGKSSEDNNLLCLWEFLFADDLRILLDRENEL